MRLFRLCRQKYAELTGYGAKRTGGRWNRKGISALYTAEHASLAVVEVLVHLDRTEIPSDFVFLEVSVADEYILTLPSAESSEEFLKAVFQTGAGALPPNIVGFSDPVERRHWERRSRQCSGEALLLRFGRPSAETLRSMRPWEESRYARPQR